MSVIQCPKLMLPMPEACALPFYTSCSERSGRGREGGRLRGVRETEREREGERERERDMYAYGAQNMACDK
jgi:hypothetical protein